MKYCKVISTHELAKLVHELPLNATLDFAAEWTENTPTNTLRSHDCAAWYGCHKVALFDGVYPLVICDYYGGGCSFCFEADPDTMEADFNTYLCSYIGGTSVPKHVCVELKK